jgi:hypothetical protein
VSWDQSMSSPPNRVYRSKLFSFLNRQYIKFKDGGIKTLRSLKITLTWSTQILLYPIYLFVQTGRLLERQLTQRIKSLQLPSQSENTLPSAIEATLTDIQDWFPEEIKAIATEREEHKLILVESDQTLLDILNEQQQKELNKIIVNNLASYWRQSQEKQQIVLVKKFPNLLPPIKTHNSHIIFPIRLFWEIMEWVQSSQVAIAVNLFGEAYLERETTDWESLQALYNLIAQAIDYFFGKYGNQIEILGTKVSDLPSGESKTINLKGIKEIAIAYFLGQTPITKTNSLPENANYNNEQWLSWQDLFNEIESTQESSLEKIAAGSETDSLNYIETKATSLGYVQHPLERVLHWLDTVMEWLEDWCIKIWSFFTKKR